MKTTLFIGNGLNLASDQGASWNALLNKLAGKPGDAHEESVRKAKPFTLWFEEISSRTPSRELKELIAASLKNDVAPNHHHVDVMALDADNILTTNYDYNLEKASGNICKSNNLARETYYSLFRRKSAGEKHIWHIHGELNNIQSIMLGHEQYSGYIQKIRNYLTSGVLTEARERNGRPYLSKFSPRSKGSDHDMETWVDLFLESEVHIIGFGFDYTENHLWNLLTEKRSLRRRGQIVGDTIFHRCSTGKPSIIDEARLSIMEAMGVKLRHYVARSYSASYDKCISSLA